MLFRTEILTSNQDAFGMLMPSRTYKAPGVDRYRFSFNGMEQDDEVKNEGNSLDFCARIYDSRQGRWMSLDAKAKAFQSNYVFARNCPVTWIDPDGNDDYFYDKSTNTWSVIRTSDPHKVFTQTWIPLNADAKDPIIYTPVSNLMNAEQLAEHLYTNTTLLRDMWNNAKSIDEQIQLFSMRQKRANKDGVKVMIGTVGVPIIIIGGAELGAPLLATKTGETFLVNAGVNTASQLASNGGDINKVDWADAVVQGGTSIIPGGKTVINYQAILLDSYFSSAIDLKFTGISYVGDGEKSYQDFYLDFGAGIISGTAGDLTSQGISSAIKS